MNTLAIHRLFAPRPRLFIVQLRLASGRRQSWLRLATSTHEALQWAHLHWPDAPGLSVLPLRARRPLAVLPRRARLTPSTTTTEA